jgi:hypothetical protein
MHEVPSSRRTTYVRSWGYDDDRPLTPQQEDKLADLLDRYHAVQTRNVVTELDVTDAVLGRAKPFSRLTVAEANKVAAHLLVRIALHTHFAEELPEEPLSFAEEGTWLMGRRLLADRVISRAGWDTAEYFLPAHPLN